MLMNASCSAAPLRLSGTVSSVLRDGFCGEVHGADSVAGTTPPFGATGGFRRLAGTGLRAAPRDRGDENVELP